VTSPEAKRIVLGCVAVAGTLSAVTDLTGGQAPRLRIFIGACIAGAVLAMAAEMAPVPAATLALTLAASTVFLSGPATWQRLSSFFS
jgi:hypothetical protein